MKKDDKKPPLVVIFSLLLLVSGISSIFPALYLLLANKFLTGGVLGGLALISIIIAIGLLKMKRWSLYLYTFWLVASILIFGYYGFLSSQRFFTQFLIMLPGIGALIYFWCIRKRFLAK